MTDIKKILNDAFDAELLVALDLRAQGEVPLFNLRTLSVLSGWNMEVVESVIDMLHEENTRFLVSC